MYDSIGKNVLITTSDWFYAPDGKSYRAVWGKLVAIQEASKMFGFTPNRAHANWYIHIGNMRIMGCRAMYFIETDTCPPEITEKDTIMEGSKVSYYDRPTHVYNSNVKN